ncbi:hypothetical protein [Rhodopila globiformis]|uniref:Uncharacterized protein n=1 Tax=Rhodopila globiformis TaxID=1071 RepID=A0A2S6N0M1_RHOGL|nr:hypothetical protein [Rhodopila globiformis]PPQ28136.1 hypothetical protein CCS01_25175 [Rhodopila globiformis]
MAHPFGSRFILTLAALALAATLGGCVMYPAYPGYGYYGYPGPYYGGSYVGVGGGWYRGGGWGGGWHRGW